MSCNSSGTYVFLFIVILHISDIISAFWRYRNKSRSRPRLLEQFFLLSLNLNSIAGHNFIKMSLLQPYNAIHEFDTICLSETYLDNSYHTDDDQLVFPGFNLIRADKHIT